MDRKSILIVDDLPENIDSFSRILKDYTVYTATDGAKALEIAESDPIPDLILLDVMMPGISGHEVCKKLKSIEKTRDIPVIFITATGNTEEENRGFDVGAADYITKPCSPPILLKRIKTHLDLKEASKNLKQQNEMLQENARLRDHVERISRHDLKNSLIPVFNVPHQLMKDLKLSARHIDLLRMIEKAGFRMLEIINKSLDLYKMETGKYQLQPVPVDLIKQLTLIQNETGELFNMKRLAVDININGRRAGGTDTFMVSGEEMLYYSLLLNLIKNAAEASPPGERITVDLSEENGPAIQIHNMGPVPREIRDKFFDKYVSFGKKTGTGLGTYSARLITEAMGGSISYETSDETGTTLTIKASLVQTESKMIAETVNEGTDGRS